MSLEEFLAALGKEDMPESGMAPSARVRFHEYADAELMQWHRRWAGWSCPFQEQGTKPPGTTRCRPAR
ncbi:MAG: hypothetical protein ACLRWP_09095 [Bilophila wadsworthia]